MSFCPWLLLLDEPSEGIQPSIVQEIGEILARLRDEASLTMIIVEQNLDPNQVAAMKLLPSTVAIRSSFPMDAYD